MVGFERLVLLGSGGFGHHAFVSASNAEKKKTRLLKEESLSLSMDEIVNQLKSLSQMYVYHSLILFQHIII